MIVGQFLQWMETAPPEQRVDAVRSLALSYLEPGIDEAARSDIESVLTVALDDPEPDVRVVVAEIFGANAKAPRARRGRPRSGWHTRRAAA